MSGTAEAIGSVAVNDQIAVGLIGINGMGMTHVQQVASNVGAQVVALCDIDDSVSARVVSAVKEIAGNTPRTSRDCRAIIDDHSIDAAVIATPHHWHCSVAVPALLAGTREETPVQSESLSPQVAFVPRTRQRRLR